MSVARQKASPFWALSAKDLPAGSALVKALGPAISFADLLRENLPIHHLLYQVSKA